jgi:signal transduction histidine kinase
VGTAIRTGAVSVCHNTLTDPQFAPWREAARRQQYGSVIALPLMVDGKCIGVLCLYGPRPDMFDHGEQLLLEDLANDLAFGISMLRLRAERERLEDEILKSIEREQERIGRDLHDGLCQLLVGAKYRSVYLRGLAKDRLPALEKEAQSLEELLNGAIQQARELARGLNPVMVTPAGLATALQNMAAEVGRAEGPRCFCQFPRSVKIFDQHVAGHLYRIAQEAVQNAFKHGRAKNISITLDRHKNLVSLVVKDDGIGIPLHPGESGMGLKNMQTRARLIGGVLEIRRRKHGGTAVTCQFPHKPGPNHERQKD